MSAAGLRAGARLPALALLLVAFPAGVAAESAGTLHHSFDVTVARGGAAYEDETIIRESPAPAWSAASLGALPPGSDLTALARAGDGRWLFALDTFVDLGSVEAGPEDVLSWNGAAHALAFDGSAAGVPAGAAVDALAVAPGGALLLSFDVAIPVAAAVADDADLVSWDGIELALAFVATEWGIPAALDLDAVDVDATDDSLLLSFDGSGSLGGVEFDDHDLLRLADGAWSRIELPGLAEAGTAAADLDAVVYDGSGLFADGFETGGTGRWSDAT